METSTRNFSWFSLIVGLISIVVGVWCICTPGTTLAALTVLFIIGFFAAGVLEICLAFTTIRSQGWGWRLTAGIIDILLGIWLCAMPAGQAATILVYVIGFYIFFYSAMGIGESVHLSRYGVSGWGWMLFFNIVGVLASFLFLISPVFGGVFVTWLVGLSFISYGLYRCMLPSVN